MDSLYIPKTIPRSNEPLVNPDNVLILFKPNGYFWLGVLRLFLLIIDAINPRSKEVQSRSI